MSRFFNDNNFEPKTLSKSVKGSEVLPEPRGSMRQHTAQTSAKVLQHHGQCITWYARLLPQLSLVLINWPQRDGMLSWHWQTAATGEIWTHKPAIISATLYLPASVVNNFFLHPGHQGCEISSYKPRNRPTNKETNKRERVHYLSSFAGIIKHTMNQSLVTGTMPFSLHRRAGQRKR